MLILMVGNTINFPCEFGALVTFASKTLCSTTGMHCLCAQEHAMQPLNATVLVSVKDNEAKGEV
jgi:hypothetical protein